MMGVQYKTVVDWDVSLVCVGFVPSNGGTYTVGLGCSAVKITTGAPAANTGKFILSAKIYNAVDGTEYRQTASGVWSLVTSEVSVSYNGTLTGQTTDTRVYSVTGITAISVVVASINASQNAVSIQKVTPGTDTITVLFSADPGTGTTLSYLTA